MISVRNTTALEESFDDSEDLSEFSPIAWVTDAKSLLKLRPDLKEHFQFENPGGERRKGSHFVAFERERDIRRLIRELQGQGDIKIVPPEKLLFAGVDEVVMQACPVDYWRKQISQERLAIQDFAEMAEDALEATYKGYDKVKANLEIQSLKERTGLRDYTLEKEYLEPIRQKLERLYKGDKTTEKGGKKSLLLERYQAAKEVLGDRLRWNELKMAPELDGKPLDFDTIQITLAEETGLDFPEAHVRSVLLRLAMEHSYDPVKDYLEQVYSQHKDDLLTDNLSEILLGTTDPLYNTYLFRHLIGSVARRYQPGCKMDTMLVLKGDQGIRKSSFLQTLYGSEFFDSTPADAGNGKDELLRQHTHWCNEQGELDGITSKKDAARMKAELSNPKDTFRPPYGRNTKEYPRRFVNVGTTNADSFLVDSTGDRRFWVIDLGSQMIDLSKVRELRDKIWATAVAAYKNGEQWWLTQQEQAQSSLANEAYAVADTWEDYILAFLDQELKKGVLYTTVAWCLADSKLSIEPSRQTKADQNRCADLLRRAGWYKKPKKVAGIKINAWFPPHDGKVPTPPGGNRGVGTAETASQQELQPEVSEVPTPNQEKSKSNDEYSSSEIKNISIGVGTSSKKAANRCSADDSAVPTPSVPTPPLGWWVRIPSEGNKLAQVKAHTPAGAHVKGEEFICGVYPDAVPLTKEEMLKKGLSWTS